MRLLNKPVCFALFILAGIKAAAQVTTPIHQIQGNGSKASSGIFTITGIVTAVYPGLKPAGFYVQEEDKNADADPATSEAIFIISTAAVQEGDKVQVTGTVSESPAAPSYGQAILSASSVSILDTGFILPAFTILSLSGVSNLEWYEGMLIQFKDTLTVTANDKLGSYGELTLSEGGICRQPTQIADPNDILPSGTNASGDANRAAVQAYNTANKARSIILDDAAASMTVLPFVNGDQTVRIGSVITRLSGIMAYGYRTYRILVLPRSMPLFQYAPRPPVPVYSPAANVRIVAFNLMNYFNGDGAGKGFPTLRGAQSAAEFTRQRNKIIAALTAINADIAGLAEIENDGTGAGSAIQDLVNGLNAVMGPDTYRFIWDGDTIQSGCADPIRSGILYKPSVLDTLGPVRISTDAIFRRPPVAQTFRLRASGVSFNYIINHLKSKGCSRSKGPDKDQLDGQGCYNDTRKQQAAALVQFIRDTLLPITPYTLSMGDYNAYFEEDPMDTIRSAGFTVLGDATGFSYLFEGQAGTLDHVVVNDATRACISSVVEWHINAAEPDFLNYKDTIDDGRSDMANKWGSAYTPEPFRSSDHDPVLVGLNLSSTGIAAQTIEPFYHLYPNPAKEMLYLQSKRHIHWKIAAPAGQVVLSGNGTGMMTIRISTLTPGLYMLYLHTDDGAAYIERWLKR